MCLRAKSKDDLDFGLTAWRVGMDEVRDILTLHLPRKREANGPDQRRLAVAIGRLNENDWPDIV